MAKASEGGTSVLRRVVSVVWAAGARVADAIGRGDRPSHAVATREFQDESDALVAFDRAASGLFTIARWSGYAGPAGLVFTHHTPGGDPAEAGRAAVGDFIRIDVPGEVIDPCWVRIEAIALAPERAALTVRPSHDPTRRPERPELTAHFFTRAARSLFSVSREGRVLVARVDGSHEVANTGAECESPEKAVRNRLLAEAGWGLRAGAEAPVAGVQPAQWTLFARNMIA